MVSLRWGGARIHHRWVQLQNPPGLLPTILFSDTFLSVTARANPEPLQVLETNTLPLSATPRVQPLEPPASWREASTLLAHRGKGEGNPPTLVVVFLKFLP